MAPRVATLTKDNRVHWQKIVVGRTSAHEMEVLSGLQDNEVLILNLVDDLTEGIMVTVKPAVVTE